MDVQESSGFHILLARVKVGNQSHQQRPRFEASNEAFSLMERC